MVCLPSFLFLFGSDFQSFSLFLQACLADINTWITSFKNRAILVSITKVIVRPSLTFDRLWTRKKSLRDRVTPGYIRLQSVINIPNQIEIIECRYEYMRVCVCVCVCVLTAMNRFSFLYPSWLGLLVAYAIWSHKRNRDRQKKKSERECLLRYAGFVCHILVYNVEQ